MKQKTVFGAALLMAAALVSPAALSAEGKFTAHFGALATGKATTLSKTHIYWSGAFSGAIYAEAGAPFEHAFVTCPSANDIDLAAGKNVISGYCRISDGADSSVVVTFTCDGPPGGCKGTATWADGVGKWEGLTAKAEFTAQLGPALEDGSVPTYATWNVSYQMP